MEETRIDMRLQTPDEIAEGKKAAQLCFRLGQTMPYTPEYGAILSEMFEKNGIGEGTRIMPGMVVVRPGSVHIGRNCVVMNGCLMMGAASVVTKDIPDNCIAVGNPAKVIKTIPGQ